MTTKHFEMIADIIRTFPEGQRKSAALRFCTQLRRVYPRFKSHIFLRWCGLSDAEVAALQDIK